MPNVPEFMRTTFALLLCLTLQTIAGGSGQTAARGAFTQRDRASVWRSEVRTESLDLVDRSRNREVPVELYSPAPARKISAAKRSKLKLAIISHGYGGQNTDYSFIARNLVAHGYLVASIQHELPSDEPMATTGSVFEARKPHWERGVQNILFVIRELKRTKPDLDFESLLLVGHSNGGDTSILFAREHPQLVRQVVSLDSRRMPFPRAEKPRILSLRSSDQTADAGVLPTPAEQERFKMRIVKLDDTIHNDMWDGASDKQKLEMNRIISGFLEN